ncbi:MAG TPA: DUF397 domain-containing protein [Actinomycetota bacterium]|jgi:hypothetical protein|nr:DUF397 domain-containing protein [Actinomycetota bacterium]
MDLSTASWRKSSHSGSNGCVEVARQGDQVALRDSKHPGGGVLVFTAHEWRAFLDGVRGGEFDEPEGGVQPEFVSR